MTIYFAGSVRGGRDDQALYLQIIEMLGRYGKVLTEHIGNKELSSYGELIPELEIYRRDLEWLMSSDLVVAEITHPSLGVGYEIGRYESLGRPILCLYREIPGQRVSAMLVGNPRVSIRTYRVIDDLDAIFTEFFAGQQNTQLH